MTARNAQLALAFAAVVALMLVVLLLRGGIGGPSDGQASPSPTRTAASTASPTATISPATAPSPTATTVASPSPSPSAANVDHGYVVAGSNADFAIRAESDGRVLRTFSGIHAVTSPDGRTIAYWKTAAGGATPHALTLLTVATGAERSLFQPSAQRGGAIVWSNDGSGLVFALETPRSGGPPSGPARAELHTWDLTASQAAGATSSELTLTDGRVWIPVAWDRSGQIVSAVTTGEGGFAIEYVTWDRRTQPAGAGPIKFTRFPWRGVIAGSVRASLDAKLVLGPDIEANVLRVWPVGDIGAGDEVRPPAGVRLGHALWRPGTPGDIAWSLGDRIDLFTYGTGSSRTLYTGASPLSLATWRADGSALVVYEPRPPERRIILVDVVSGRAAPIAWVSDPGAAVFVDSVVLR